MIAPSQVGNWPIYNPTLSPSAKAANIIPDPRTTYLPHINGHTDQPGLWDGNSRSLRLGPQAFTTTQRDIPVSRALSADGPSPAMTSREIASAAYDHSGSTSRKANLWDRIFPKNAEGSETRYRQNSHRVPTYGKRSLFHRIRVACSWFDEDEHDPIMIPHSDLHNQRRSKKEDRRKRKTAKRDQREARRLQGYRVAVRPTTTGRKTDDAGVRSGWLRDWLTMLSLG